MEYSLLLEKYAPAIAPEEVDAVVAKAKSDSVKNRTADVYKLCYSAIDLTSLTESDSVVSIAAFVKKAVGVEREFPCTPNVATICVFPPFVDVAGLGVEGTSIGVTSVAAGFPASQTFLEVKMLEVAMAVENGADEIDVVINVGELLSGDYDRMANDIELLREEVGEDVIFKVIIESGALKTPELIRRASLLAMFAGADFVKTSTGKIPVAATPEAAVVMCMAIKDYYAQTGRKVGFKAAGGIRTAEDSALFYTIIENILGQEWLTPSLFRIGASSLANNLLSAIAGREVKYF
jgi:deoxyribose-phosphate aldolase